MNHMSGTRESEEGESQSVSSGPALSGADTIPRERHHHLSAGDEGGLFSGSSEEDEEDEDFIPLSGLDDEEGDDADKPVLAGIGVLVQRLGGQVTVVDLVQVPQWICDPFAPVQQSSLMMLWRLYIMSSSPLCQQCPY